MSDVEMHLKHEKDQWRVVHFPHDYEEVHLMKKSRAELVGIIMQLNTNGKALEHACQSQEETIEKLGVDRDALQLSCDDYVRRIALLHDAGSALLHLMAGETVGDVFDIE